MSAENNECTTAPVVLVCYMHLTMKLHWTIKWRKRLRRRTTRIRTRRRARTLLTPSEMHSNIDSKFGASIFGKTKSNKSITEEEKEDEVEE